MGKTKAGLRRNYFVPQRIFPRSCGKKMKLQRVLPFKKGIVIF